MLQAEGWKPARKRLSASLGTPEGGLFPSWDQLVQISKPLVLWLGFLGCTINGIFQVASAHTPRKINSAPAETRTHPHS